MIGVLIAAAGKSTRMGRAKALLDFHGLTFVKHLVQRVCNGKIDRIFVTLPECPITAAQIKRELDGFSVHFYQNLFPDRELLGSVQTVLENEKGFDALIIVPVDMPFICAQIVDQFIQSFRGSKKSEIFCAVHKSQREHPVMFSHTFFREILSLNEKESLRTVINRHPDQIVDIEFSEVPLHLNINTPEDYVRLTKPSSRYLEAAAIDAPGTKSL